MYSKISLDDVSGIWKRFMTLRMRFLELRMDINREPFLAFHSRSLHSTHETVGAADPADTPVSYQAPGLDYSMPSRRETTPSSSIYNPHNLISHLPSQQPPSATAAAAVAANASIQRPDSAHNPVQYSYNPTPSPIQSVSVPVPDVE